MKKNLYIAALLCLTNYALQAQNSTDAIRFSQSDISGTARFSAMSGAFGALGGDLSAIGINPAGSVIFNNNQAGMTLAVYAKDNDSNYFGTKSNESDVNFDLNQAGVVWIFRDTEKSDWKKFALALNYDNTKNLSNTIFSTGVNSNSVSNYFLSYANGIQQGVLSNDFGSLNYSQQQAFLGYQAYIINPASNSSSETNYFSNVPLGANYFQRQSFTSSGINGKISFNAAAQYKDFLSIGINLNAHFIDYRQSTAFAEENDFQNTSTDYLVNRLAFYNDLYTYGNGFSIQVGAILKPTNEIRLGLTYQSPTWYNLNDELSQSAVAISRNDTSELAPDIVNPRLTMIYEPYKLRTPSKYTGSFAYIFGKNGLISFDYSLKDYNNILLKPTNDFIGENHYMATALKAASEFRLGAEYKIKNWSLRGGYNFEESPYKDAKVIGDLYGISSGLGYNFGDFKVDLAYTYSKRNYQNQFFTQGLTDYSTVSAINNSFFATVLFEL